MPPYTVKRGGFTGKRRETHGFTPFSCRFHLFSLDSAAKRRDFKRFQRVTEKNRAFHRRFHAVRRRFLRSRSCSPCFVSGRKTPEKDGARPFHLPKSQNHPPASRRPRGSGGRATGFRRQRQGPRRIPYEKILRGSSFPSTPLALCEVCLIAGKMLQNHSKINTISIILLKNIFMI